MIPADGSAPPKQLTFRNDIGAAPAARRRGQPGPRLDAGRQAGALQVPPGALERPHRPALPRAGRGRHGDARCRCRRAAPARSRRTAPSSPTRRSCASSAPGSATSGGRAQDVWIYDLKNDTAERLTDFAGTDNHAGLDRRHDLLHLGPRRLAAQSLRLRPAARSQTAPGHEPRSVRRALAERRRPPHRLPSRRAISTSSTRPRGRRGRCRSRSTATSRATLPYFKNVTADIAVHGPLADRQARGARRPRRDLHRAGAEGGDPQPDLHARHPRDGRGLVARRPLDRLPVGPQRRVRGLRPAERRLRRGAAGDHGRQGLALPARSGRPTRRRSRSATRTSICFWVDVQSGKIDRGRPAATASDIFDYRWSPDSRWLAYTKEAETQLDSIWVYSLDDEEGHAS